MHQTRTKQLRLIIPMVGFLLFGQGCAVFKLMGYARNPDYPTVTDGQTISMTGLQAPVTVTFSAAGVPFISATNEADLMFATGYLQARDRMAQLDIFRHLARGELSALVGEVPFGMKSSLDVDAFNRFMGFAEEGEHIFEQTSLPEQAAVQAFARGINAWIAEGKLPLEHRLLGVDQIRPWAPTDSLAIYRMLMFGLSANYNREIRRLVVACESGLETAARIWPMDVAFGVYALPDNAVTTGRHSPAPAIVPELRAAWPELCSEDMMVAEASGPSQTGMHPRIAALLEGVVELHRGFSASNNWVVAGKHTATGAPVFSNDPHLPHMNPPILWGMQQQIPEYRVAGFTLPGIHRVVFGHNGYVAWGATTNHVDRQDLVVHRTVDGGYLYEGAPQPFTTLTEVFEVRGGRAVEKTARYTRDGLILNDVEPALRDGIPLVALRTTGISGGKDIDAARAMTFSKDADEFVSGLQWMDSGCTSWVYADRYGKIGFESPCVLPQRPHHSGSFPIPGWLSRYNWGPAVDKASLPRMRNPERGWLATANSRLIPQERFPTTYNGDPAAPHRFQRIAEMLMFEIQSADKMRSEASARMQLDVEDFSWRYAEPVLKDVLCETSSESKENLTGQALVSLCKFDGRMTAESSAATLFVLLTNAMLDRALADELRGGAEGWTWEYVQSLSQFEVNVQWMWVRPENDPVWDDVRTEQIEQRADILRAAFDDAVRRAADQYGAELQDWQWGSIRPQKVKHMFAGGDGMLGGLLNSAAVPGKGSPTTVMKSQFNRSDREHLYGAIGPPARFTVDLADPWATEFTLAGGQSGWPKSPHYADLYADWHAGRSQSLQPTDSKSTVTFVPPGWLAGEPSDQEQ